MPLPRVAANATVRLQLLQIEQHSEQTCLLTTRRASFVNLLFAASSMRTRLSERSFLYNRRLGGARQRWHTLREPSRASEAQYQCLMCASRFQSKLGAKRKNFWTADVRFRRAASLTYFLFSLPLRPPSSTTLLKKHLDSDFPLNVERGHVKIEVE